MSQPAVHRYSTRHDLADALAGGVAAVLAGGIATRGMATLAVSGGSTPDLFLQALSRAEIDWADVTVMLVDERWVPETSPRSNATFLRRHLLQGPAASARFIPFHMDVPTPEEAEEELCKRFERLARPFDAAILGMGADGHTASFFPGAASLGRAVDPLGSAPVVAIRANGAEEPRVTLSLPRIVESRFLALHIEGEEKWRVLEAASAPGPIHDLPVRAVLQASREKPLDVFWAP